MDIQKLLNMTITGKDVREHPKFQKLPGFMRTLRFRLATVLCLGSITGLGGVIVLNEAILPKYERYVFTQTVIEVHPAFEIIARSFPKEFDQIQTLFRDNRLGLNSPGALNRSVQVVFLQMQEKYSWAVASASEEKIREILEGQLDVIQSLERFGQYETCALVASRSPRLTQVSMPSESRRHLDRASQAVFTAMAEGYGRSDTDSVKITRYDWSSYINAAVSRGVPLHMVDILAGQWSDVTPKELCGSAIAFLEDLLTSENEIPKAVLADVARAFSGNNVIEHQPVNVTDI